jgi:hypothetical protein
MPSVATPVKEFLRLIREREACGYSTKIDRVIQANKYGSWFYDDDSIISIHCYFYDKAGNMTGGIGRNIEQPSEDEWAMEHNQFLWTNLN